MNNRLRNIAVLIVVIGVSMALGAFLMNEYRKASRNASPSDPSCADGRLIVPETDSNARIRELFNRPPVEHGFYHPERKGGADRVESEL